jgi:bacteriorhodopsin
VIIAQGLTLSVLSQFYKYCFFTCSSTGALTCDYLNASDWLHAREAARIDVGAMFSAVFRRELACG